MNYGDVSLLLRGWLDLCAEFAWRHYDGNPPVIPPDNACYRQRLAQERILAFCQNEPNGIREIGRCSATGTRRPSGSILTRCRLPGRLYGPFPTGPTAEPENHHRPEDLSFSMRCLFDGMSGEFFFPGGVVIERFGGRGSQRARGPSPASRESHLPLPPVPHLHPAFSLPFESVIQNK